MSPCAGKLSPRVTRSAARRTFELMSFACAAVALLVVAAGAVAAQTTYKKPPPAVLDVLNAPVSPVAYVSPQRDYMLLATGVRYPPISELAQPMLRLAGMRINPNLNGRHNTPYFVSLAVKKIADGTETKVELPAGAKIVLPQGAAQWSPDGKSFFFMNHTPAGIELWVCETATAKAWKLKGVTINAVNFAPVQWMPDGKHLLAHLVPAKRGATPAAPTVPTGPNEQQSMGKATGAATYQDLLKNPYDEDLFDHYASAQLALVDAASGKTTTLGRPAVFDETDPAPDGKHLLVARLHRPYSYLHPADFFPLDIEVWDTSGRLVKQLASLPLADSIPLQGVRLGPRSIQWHPTAPATLVWVEALDGGDPKKKVAQRDRVMSAKAPFVEEAREVFKTEQRFAGLQFFEKGSNALVSDFDRDKRWTRTLLLDFDDPQAKPREVWSRNVNDQYNNPGAPVTRLLPTGHRAILQNGDSIYLSGAGASPEGDRPFLDRMSLQTLKSERLFRSSSDSYETVVALLSDDARQLVTRRERTAEPPNYFVRATTGDVASTNPSSAGAVALRPLTQFSDPTPQLQGIKKQLVKYKRADGVDLSFTLYLPPGYKEGTRLPTVVWAYPLEFNDPGTAGQVTGSTQRYTTIIGYSHLFFLLEGYAVLDNTTMPVVGDPETVNDTYVEQIVASAKAAIDKATEMGVTDPERVGVGGHSYGAFMTANLLAHSDLFRAGIARSGAYNRTLTPFGFQSERRTFWEAPGLYMKVSPFVVANKINEPILLTHGEADNNSGTYPIQSERLYQAIRGTGGTVRLVTLPLESHGYVARESTEHVLYEMINWFDRYVKNAPPRKPDTQKAEK